MTEEALDIFEDGAKLPEDQNQNEPENNDDKPAPRGYMSKEAWTESGKNPDEWVSEEVFKERGERIKQTTKLQRDFENQLKNVNLLHKIQLEKQRNDLVSRRDDLIDVADKAGVKAIDKQIKDLDDLAELTEEKLVQPEKPVEVAAWENSNPWINDPKDPRTSIAQKAFVAATGSGMDVEEALEHVDTILAKKFSTKASAPRQMVESSRSSGGKREEAVLTMKNLTKEEKMYWDEGFFSSEKEFLQAVSNSRKGVK